MTCAAALAQPQQRQLGMVRRARQPGIQDAPRRKLVPADRQRILDRGAAGLFRADMQHQIGQFDVPSTGSTS